MKKFYPGPADTLPGFILRVIIVGFVLVSVALFMSASMSVE